MRRVNVTYIILDSFEVDDDDTPYDIDRIIENGAHNLGIYDLVDNAEWYIDD